MQFAKTLADHGLGVLRLHNCCVQKLPRVLLNRGSLTAVAVTGGAHSEGGRVACACADICCCQRRRVTGVVGSSRVATRAVVAQKAGRSAGDPFSNHDGSILAWLKHCRVAKARQQAGIRMLAVPHCDVVAGDAWCG